MPVMRTFLITAIEIARFQSNQILNLQKLPAFNITTLASTFH